MPNTGIPVSISTRSNDNSPLDVHNPCCHRGSVEIGLEDMILSVCRNTCGMLHRPSELP